MTMLADQVDVVIGVDTHKHTNTAAVVRASTGDRTALSVLLAARRSAFDGATVTERQMLAILVAAPETLRGGVRQPRRRGTGPSVLRSHGPAPAQPSR